MSERSFVINPVGTHLTAKLEWSGSPGYVLDWRKSPAYELVRTEPPPLVSVTINSEHFGDSITEGAAGGAGDNWVTRLSVWMDGVQDNEGVGGQTSTQIKDRVIAQSAGDLAKMHTLMMGTNNASAVSTILADYATSVAAITGETLVLGPIGSGNMLGTMGYLNRVTESLRETYGDNFLNVQHIFREQGPFTTDLNAVRAGTMPAALMADATHPSNATGAPLLAEEIGRAMRALSGTAEPFVHDDLVTWDSSAAEDAVIHTARKLGTVTSWAYTNDPGDNLFKVNASGQILRGSGTTYPDGGIATIQLRGINANGGHTGRLLMAREAETDQPIYGVRVSGQGSILSRRLAAGESFPFMANGTAISVVMLVKFPSAVISGAVFFTTHSTLSMVGTTGAMRFIPRDTSGAQLGTASISSPAVTDKDEWHWLMFSFDSSSNVASAVSASPTDGVQSTTTITGTPIAGTMGLSRIDGLFTNNSGDTAPWSGDIKMLWVAPNYIDFSSATERDRFFDSGTLAPVTMAADGVVNSISPAIYMRGRCGDWLKGRNFAPSGNRLFAPFPIDADNAVILDVAVPLAAPAFVSSSISGTAQDGEVLTANATVTGNPTPTLAYQWQKNGTNISGQTSGTITLDESGMSLTEGDIISCEITATNSQGSASAEPTIEYTLPTIDRLVMPSPAGYFVSTTGSGSGTTSLSFSGKYNFPSITNGMLLVGGVSDPVRLAVLSDGSLTLTVEASNGVNALLTEPVAPAGSITTGAEIEVLLEVDYTAETATVTIDGGTPIVTAFTTAGTGFASSSRLYSLLASNTGTNALPAGTVFRDLAMHRNGVLFKSISNSASVANADAWHQGGNFTQAP